MIDAADRVASAAGYAPAATTRSAWRSTWPRIERDTGSRPGIATSAPWATTA